jgi:hypothetical protein
MMQRPGGMKDNGRPSLHFPRLADHGPFAQLAKTLIISELRKRTWPVSSEMRSRPKYDAFSAWRKAKTGAEVVSIAGYLKRAIDGGKEVSQLVSGNEGERLASNQGVSADNFDDKGVVLRRNRMVEGKRKAPRLITNRDAISDTSEGTRLVSVDGGITRDDYRDKGVTMKGENTVDGVEKNLPSVSDGAALSGALEGKRFLSVCGQEAPPEKLRKEGVVVTGDGTAGGEKTSTEPIGNGISRDEVEQRFSERGVYLETVHEKGVITNGTIMIDPGKGAPENVGSFVSRPGNEQRFSSRPVLRKSGQGEARRLEDSPIEEEITYQA